MGVPDSSSACSPSRFTMCSTILVINEPLIKMVQTVTEGGMLATDMVTIHSLALQARVSESDGALDSCAVMHLSVVKLWLCTTFVACKPNSEWKPYYEVRLV